MSSKKVITGPAVLSYPHIAEPTTMNGDNGQPGKPKYSTSLVFLPAEDGTPPNLAELEAAVLAVAEEAFGTKAALMLKNKTIASPFRLDGEAKGYPAGAVFINVRSEQQPGVVYSHRGPDGKPAIVPQDEIETVFYPGAIVRASISAFAYNFNNMKKGVSFGLNNLQKLSDGKRLDNRLAAVDEFEATEDLAPADLSDLNA